MTEKEWFNSADIAALFRCVERYHNDRKWLLLIAACCRDVGWRCNYADETEQAEKFERDAETTRDRTWYFDGFRDAWDYAWRACSGCAERVANDFINKEGIPFQTQEDVERVWGEVFEREMQRQAGFVRDIFGNPFRPVTCDPAWLTDTVVALAKGIYDERAFERMPILADALQDAGCDNEEVLNHCRQPGEHVRGCWVLDLLTGRK